MATINLGRIKPIWQGAWTTGTAYVKDDIVREGVDSYICVTAHTAGATFAGDSANWELMAQGAELPSQSGNAGSALKTDGTNLSWGAAGGLVKVLEFDSSNVNATVFDLNYIFTDDYSTYELVLQWYPTSDTSNAEMRLMAGSTQDNSDGYRSVIGGSEASTTGGNSQQFGYRSGDSWNIRPAGGNVGSNTSFGGAHQRFTFYDVRNTSSYVKYHASYTMMRDLGDNIHGGHLSGIFKNNVSSVYTGLRFFGIGSNFGRVKAVVYGYEGS